MIAGFVSLVAGFATGPAGWVAIVANYAGAFSTFTGLTSMSYATHQRMEYSRSACAYLENARDNMYYSYWDWSNASSSVVNGF